MDKKELIEVGIILKPHGIKGLVKVKPLCFGNFKFIADKSVIIDGNEYKISSVSANKEELLVKFDGIDIAFASKLHNVSVYAKRTDVKNNGFFWVDLIGKNLVSGGKDLGKIVDIQNFGSADVFYVSSKKPFLFSNIGGILESFDENNVYANFDKLSEVICYED